MTGGQGLAGWQWLCLIEALPSLALGVAVLVYLDDRIGAAHWLTAGEKDLLARRLAEDNSKVPSHSLVDGLTNPSVWLLAALYFFLICVLYVSGFSIPSLIRRSSSPCPSPR